MKYLFKSLEKKNYAISIYKESLSIQVRELVLVVILHELFPLELSSIKYKII